MNNRVPAALALSTILGGLLAGCVSVEEEERHRLEQAKFYYEEGCRFYDEARSEPDRAASREKYDLALEAFTNAIGEHPTGLPDAYARRGHVHFRMEEDTAAIADYSTALRLDPTQEVGLFNRGEAYRRLATKDSTFWGRALRDFQEYHRANPSHLESLLRVGAILYEHAPSRWREAREFLARYLELAGPAANTQVTSWLANIDRELGPPPTPSPSPPPPTPPSPSPSSPSSPPPPGPQPLRPEGATPRQTPENEHPRESSPPADPTPPVEEPKGGG